MKFLRHPWCLYGRGFKASECVVKYISRWSLAPIMLVSSSGEVKSTVGWKKYNHNIGDQDCKMSSQKEG